MAVKEMEAFQEQGYKLRVFRYEMFNVILRKTSYFRTPSTY